MHHKGNFVSGFVIQRYYFVAFVLYPYIESPPFRICKCSQRLQPPNFSAFSFAIGTFVYNPFKFNFLRFEINISNFLN